MKKSQVRLRIIIVILGFIFVSFSFYVYQIFFTPNILIDKEDKDTELLIPTGATFQMVKDSLEKKEIVNQKTSFYFLTRLLKYNENVKPGRYIIKRNSTNLDVIKKLKRGNQDPVKLTFNNIRLKKDLAIKLGKILEPEPNEIEALLNDTAFLSSYGFDTCNIISMFIPNTYEIYWNITAKGLFKRMQHEYKMFWTKERLEKAKGLELSPLEVSVLASIVEAETQKNAEKSRIAGVYYNRLKTNMPLQADPTLVFALGNFSVKRIYYGYKEIDSPYNTYMYTGLPPGPINFPSVKSLEAVLNCERHEYFYFCASEDLTGFHNFAETYKDHLKNAAKYQKALNQLKIR